MAKADGKIVFEIMADDSGFRKKLGGLKGTVKGGVSAMTVAAGNLISDMVKRAASGVASLAKSALDSYSTYEQMVGGVDKLFGSASDKLQRYAANAYKTSGLSANQYMEQATSFSASMITSLGGDVDKAADMTDLAMRSMADNVNVFGSNMTDVQNAYQGFAKQNYTMLDNLKLGYGGTQQEMKRLIKDASGLKDEQKKLGVTVDANSMSFANITAAIAVMQEHMGIAGTTSREAAGTIEGSVNMMKASWANFLTSLGSGKDIDAVTSQLLESVGYVVSNVGARVLQIGDSVTRALPQVAPAVAEAFASMWNTAMATLSGHLGIPTPTIDGSAIIGVLDDVRKHVQDFVANFQAAFSGSLDDQSIWTLRQDFDMLLVGVDRVADFISGPLATALGSVMGPALSVVGSVLQDVIGAVQSLAKGMQDAFSKGGTDKKISKLQKALSALWKNVLRPLGDFISGPFATALGELAGGAILLVIDAVTTAAEVVNDIGVVVEEVVGAIASGVGGLVSFVSGVPGSIEGFFSGVGSFFSGLWGGISSAARAIWDGLVSFISGVPGKVTGFFSGVGAFFSGLWNGIQRVASIAWNLLVGVVSYVPNKVMGFFRGVPGFFSGLWNGIRSVATGIWNALVGFISGIPSRITGFFRSVGGFFSGLWNGVRGTATGIWNALVSFIAGIPGRITGFFRSVGSFFSGLWNGVRGTATGIWNALVGFIAGIPGRIVNFFRSVPGRFSSIFSQVRGFIQSHFNAAANAVAGIPGRIVNFFRSVPGRIGSAVSGVAGALARPFQSAWRTISGIPGAIRNAFSRLRISIPGFKLPHVEVRWWGSPISLPHFSVNWHALGAVIDGPTLFADGVGNLHGMGESGGEAMIQPLEGAIGRGWADFVAQRVVARQGGGEVAAWLEENLGEVIAEYAPTATPRQFGRMVRGAMA